MINFLKFSKIYFIFSGMLVLFSLVALLVWGLRPSIDFVGGSLLEIRFDQEVYNQLNSERIEEVMSSVSDVSVYNVQPVPSSSSFSIRTQQIDESKKNEVMEKVLTDIGEVELLKFETVGPVLGRELLFKTVLAALGATAFILLYVARQFKDRKYGLAAILAMFHDTIILLGFFAVFGKVYGVEVDTLFVTAMLTTLSFSVHDTIVVFDRIRERSHLLPNEDFNKTINESLSQTMVRSLNNSMTIIFMLMALALLGGVTIKWFAVALLIGTISGTYSSPFIAAPLLSVFKKTK